MQYDNFAEKIDRQVNLGKSCSASCYLSLNVWVHSREIDNDYVFFCIYIHMYINIYIERYVYILYIHIYTYMSNYKCLISNDIRN